MTAEEQLTAILKITAKAMRVCYDEANRIANHCSEAASKIAMHNLYEIANEVNATLAQEATRTPDTAAQDVSRDRLVYELKAERAWREKLQSEMAALEKENAELRKIIEWKLQLVKDTTTQDCFCDDGTCWPCRAKAALTPKETR